jgi:hypothetical protein
MPTSEHRGHFGLSTSGGGIRPELAKPRAASTAASVAVTNSSVIWHADALLGSVVVNDRLVACVAVIAQDERLDAYLHTIGRPRLEPIALLARHAVLVIHQRDARTRTFDQVNNGDQPKAITRE